MYTCPVCSYDQLEFPPDDWHICYCCGTQFRYDDCGKSHEQLREEWIAGGCKWWSECDKPPADWDTRLIQIPRGAWQAVIESGMNAWHALEDCENQRRLLNERYTALLTLARQVEPYRTWYIENEFDAWDSLSSEALANFEGSLE